jgi:GMP synthase (glutamine-hydrolysing)
LLGSDASGDPAQAILAQTREHIAAMQVHAEIVFNRFLDSVGRPQRRHTLPSREWT